MHEMSDGQMRILKSWADSLDGDVHLRYAITNHTAADDFNAFVDGLANLSDMIKPKKDPDAEVARPTLFAAPRVAYQAIPDERELEPFLRMLENPSAHAGRIDPAVCDTLARLEMPAPVSVFITPGCPFCPVVVADLLGLAALNEHIWLTVVDGARFPETVAENRITAAPTVILDEQLRWTGSVDVAEVVAMMLDRDPLNLSVGALKGMIEGGDAEGVAQMMVARNTIFPAFVELLIHPRWSVRLGAMVAFESLAETAPALAAEVAPPLTAAYPALEDTTKGDLLYVLGISGNREVLPFLMDIADQASDAEVRSAADEAIAALSAG